MFQILTLTLRAVEAAAMLLLGSHPDDTFYHEAKYKGEYLRVMGR